MSTEAYSVIVRGRVQDVGFRYAAQYKARALGVSGFVRNESDGSVYIEAEGEGGKIRDFLDWCRIGPIGAHVERVETNPKPTGGYKNFEIYRV